MKKTIIYFVFFIILFNSCVINKKSINNSTSDVKNEISKAIKSEKEKNKIIIFWGDFFKKVYENLKKGKMLFRILFILIISAVILLILFFLVRFFSKKNFVNEKEESIKKDFHINSFDLNHLENILNEKNYSYAIIYLHHCSIYFLLNNGIIYKKNMTNYDLIKKITDSKISDAFKIIASFSEKILFDNYIADFNNFTVCKVNFEKNFI